MAKNNKELSMFFNNLNLEDEEQEQDSPNDRQISAEDLSEDRTDGQGDKKSNDEEKQHEVGYEQNLNQCSDTKKSNIEEICDKTNQSDSRSVKIGCLNLWSINNKKDKVPQLIELENLDVFLPTETWLNRDTGDKVLQESLPNNYSFFHWAREGRGGGVAVTYSEILKGEKSKLIDVTTFEYIAVELQCSRWCKPLLIINVYHKTERKKSDFQNFLDDLENLLIEAYNTNTSFLLTGDFNVWVDDEGKPTTQWFLELLKRNGLSQHVTESTHRQGHTLDLVIGINVEITKLVVSNHGVSDHYTICFNAHPLEENQTTMRTSRQNKQKNEE